MGLVVLTGDGSAVVADAGASCGNWALIGLGSATVTENARSIGSVTLTGPASAVVTLDVPNACLPTKPVALDVAYAVELAASGYWPARSATDAASAKDTARTAARPSMLAELVATADDAPTAGT